MPQYSSSALPGGNYLPAAGGIPALPEAGNKYDPKPVDKFGDQAGSKVGCDHNQGVVLGPSRGAARGGEQVRSQASGQVWGPGRQQGGFQARLCVKQRWHALYYLLVAPAVENHACNGVQTTVAEAHPALHTHPQAAHMMVTADTADQYYYSDHYAQ